MRPGFIPLLPARYVSLQASKWMGAFPLGVKARASGFAAAKKSATSRTCDPFTPLNPVPAVPAFRSIKYGL